jgi:hypothetical protein
MQTQYIHILLGNTNIIWFDYDVGLSNYNLNI